MSRPAVSKWESGDTENIRFANIVRLCAIFGVSADELIGGEVGTFSGGGIVTDCTAQEPAAHYATGAAAGVSPFPAHLETAYAGLTAEGRAMVDTQIEIAIETARRLYGSLPCAEKTAA